MGLLAGKTAIITGAAGGIGQVVAKDMALEGVDLSLCYHNKRCDKLVEEIERMGRDVIALRADVTDADEINAVLESTASTSSAERRCLATV